MDAIREKLAQRVAELDAQNAELVAALKCLLIACEVVNEGYYPIEAITQARAALEKAKAK